MPMPSTVPSLCSWDTWALPKHAHNASQDFLVPRIRLTLECLGVTPSSPFLGCRDISPSPSHMDSCVHAGRWPEIYSELLRTSAAWSWEKCSANLSSCGIGFFFLFVFRWKQVKSERFLFCGFAKQVSSEVHLPPRANLAGHIGNWGHLYM